MIRGEILPSVRGLGIFEGTGGGIGSGKSIGGTISSTGVQEVVLVANDMPHRKNSLNKSLLFFSRFTRTVFNA